MPFCEQIKIHLNKEITDVKGKKQKIDSSLANIKSKVAEEYNTTLLKFKQDAPNLHKLAEVILGKFDITATS